MYLCCFLVVVPRRVSISFWSMHLVYLFNDCVRACVRVLFVSFHPGEAHASCLLLYGHCCPVCLLLLLYREYTSPSCLSLYRIRRQSRLAIPPRDAEPSRDVGPPNRSARVSGGEGVEGRGLGRKFWTPFCAMCNQSDIALHLYISQLYFDCFEKLLGRYEITLLSPVATRSHFSCLLYLVVV